MRPPYSGMGALTKPAAICCGSLSLAPSKGLRGKCVLSIEPLSSVPPADPLSIFTQHLHIVIHDLLAALSNAVALLCCCTPRMLFCTQLPGGNLALRRVFYHGNPAWAWWKATSEASSAAANSSSLPCVLLFVWRKQEAAFANCLSRP